MLKYIDKILSKIMLTYDFNSDNINIKLIISLQGRVQVPTGGIAHEPLGMIRCDSEADSKVWMKEDWYIHLLFFCMYILP